MDEANARENILDLKFITTNVSSTEGSQNGKADYVAFRKGALIFTCGGGTTLEVRVLVLKFEPYQNQLSYTFPSHQLTEDACQCGIRNEREVK